MSEESKVLPGWALRDLARFFGGDDSIYRPMMLTAQMRDEAEKRTPTPTPTFEQLQSMSPEARELMTGSKTPLVDRLDLTKKDEAPPPTLPMSGYVQAVPDQCDRIVWRGNYYHLPIKADAPPPPAPVRPCDDDEMFAQMVLAVQNAVDHRGRRIGDTLDHDTVKNIVLQITEGSSILDDLIARHTEALRAERDAAREEIDRHDPTEAERQYQAHLAGCAEFELELKAMGLVEDDGTWTNARAEAAEARVFRYDTGGGYIRSMTADHVEAEFAKLQVGLSAAKADVAKLRNLATDLAASLAATISLLEKGGKAAKKAAPSDLMFDVMAHDYKSSLEKARAVLSEVGARAT